MQLITRQQEKGDYHRHGGETGDHAAKTHNGRCWLHRVEDRVCWRYVTGRRQKNGRDQSLDSESEADDKTGVFKVSLEDWTFGLINGGGPEFLFKTLEGNIYIREK